LKSVAYPRNLDVYEFCSDELKKSLDQGRTHDEKLREEDDIRRHGKTKNQTAEEAKSDPKADVEMKETNAEVKEETAETVLEYKDKNGKKLVGAAAKAAMKLAKLKKHDEILYRPHGQGLDTGAYELIGVVTHKGRSADGGHYIGWVHASGEDWIQCDDDICTSVKTEDILQLKGGGDWPTAYIALYRKIEVNKDNYTD
jgi:ubiquitin carboxyl-terminal hydrolase 14